MARASEHPASINRFLHDCACAIERDATVRVADDQLPWRRRETDTRRGTKAAPGAARND